MALSSKLWCAVFIVLTVLLGIAIGDHQLKRQPVVYKQYQATGFNDGAVAYMRWETPDGKVRQAQRFYPGLSCKRVLRNLTAYTNTMIKREVFVAVDIHCSVFRRA